MIADAFRQIFETVVLFITLTAYDNAVICNFANRRHFFIFR